MSTPSASSRGGTPQNRSAKRVSASPKVDLLSKKRLINVGNIQLPSAQELSQQFVNPKSSLNYQYRKREQAKQIEDNIQLLKKIHFAAPTISFDKYKKHEKDTERLKK